MFIDLTLYANDKKIKENKNIKMHYNKKDKALSFMDDVLTKINIEEDELIFKRICDEYEFCLKIKEENECYFTLKNEEKTFAISVDKAVFSIDENGIIINYKIKTDEEEKKVIIVKK